MTIAEAYAFKALEERLSALEKDVAALINAVTEGMAAKPVPAPQYASAGYLRAGANKRKVA